MTSNIGADLIRNSAGMGFREKTDDLNYEAMKKLLMEEVQSQFRPEFLNRIDEIIVFRSLDRDDLRDIIELQLNEIRERLSSKGLKLELTDSAIEMLIDRGYNPEFGARPLRRALERCLEDPLSEQLLQGKFPPGQILVEAAEDELKFTSTPARDDSGDEDKKVTAKTGGTRP
jgi:ATP-dependent Clp protease ATP-binding subunit ClpC